MNFDYFVMITVQYILSEGRTVFYILFIHETLEEENLVTLSLYAEYDHFTLVTLSL